MAWSNLSESERGYIAGFIDADGSITISKQRNDSGIYYRPTLSIYNNSKELLESIALKLSDGDVEYFVDKRRDSRHNRDTYVLAIRKLDDLKEVLDNLQGYLRLKDGQAKKAAEAIKLIQGRDSHKYTDELRQKLSDKHEEITVMNH